MSEPSTPDPIAIHDAPFDGAQGETIRKRQHRWNASRYISLLPIILHSPYSAPFKGAAWDRIAKDYNTAVEEPGAITGRKAREWVSKATETDTERVKSGHAKPILSYYDVWDAQCM